MPMTKRDIADIVLVWILSSVLLRSAAAASPWLANYMSTP